MSAAVNPRDNLSDPFDEEFCKMLRGKGLVELRLDSAGVITDWQSVGTRKEAMETEPDPEKQKDQIGSPLTNNETTPATGKSGWKKGGRYIWFGLKIVIWLLIAAILLFIAFVVIIKFSNYSPFKVVRVSRGPEVGLSFYQRGVDKKSQLSQKNKPSEFSKSWFFPPRPTVYVYDSPQKPKETPYIFGSTGLTRNWFDLNWPVEILNQRLDQTEKKATAAEKKLVESEAVIASLKGVIVGLNQKVYQLQKRIEAMNASVVSQAPIKAPVSQTTTQTIFQAKPIKSEVSREIKSPKPLWQQYLDGDAPGQ